ncbi:hypothetical protein CK203_093773 [Vitis vinifera]|uniref:Reverse transcriptase RNase H-like domain-containing protein n=1 Tax=Vitis vinifera TaxID=29760 RepID=A0A438C7U1_VITVI|nr:hypothetical protein CK203_093773 [Vitis vinifera]
MVSERGIEADLDKIRAILDMPAPRTKIEIRDFLGCMLAQLNDSTNEPTIYYLSKRMLDYETGYVMIERFCLAFVWATWRLKHYMIEWLVLLTEFKIHYVTQKSIRGSIVADHLALLPVFDGRAIDDDFRDEDVTTVTSLLGWNMYIDDATNHYGYRIGVLLISPCGDHLPRSVCLIRGHWKTRDVKLMPYHAYLELLVGKFDDLRYTYLPRALNQFVNALATLASMIYILVDTIVCLLLIESRYILVYCCLIDETELDDDHAFADRVMRDVHSGVCGLHMGGHICPEYKMHEDLIHMPPLELHALTSSWPFSVQGIDIIGKISSKSSSGHEFILVAIDYFTKWVEVASELTPEGATWFMDLDGNQFLKPTNVDQLKKYYA